MGWRVEVRAPHTAIAVNLVSRIRRAGWYRRTMGHVSIKPELGTTSQDDVVLDAPTTTPSAASVRFADGPIPAPASFEPIQDGRGKPVSVVYLPDDSDFDFDALLRRGEIRGGSVRDMVDKIIAKANGSPIGFLMIRGHGEPGTQQVGKGTYFDFRMDGDTATQLARLRPLFAPGAEVRLDGCFVGAGPRGESLLRTLVQLWGVRVRAGAGQQNDLGGLEGMVAIAEPHGKDDAKIRYEETVFDELRAGKGSFGADDAIVEEAETMTPARWTNLTLDHRVEMAMILLGGYTSRREGDIIVKLFSTTAPGERRRMYKYIEGHDWAGDFRHGWTVTDDHLWDDLSSEQVARLRQLLNE